MLPGRQESTKTAVTTDKALRALVQLLARQVARECIAASQASTPSASSPGRTDPIPSPNDEGGRP
jgi:hypothetical protein